MATENQGEDSMEYMKLSPMQREALLADLGEMSDYLRAVFSCLTREEARQRGADGAFSPLEQVWHLADLERDGFAQRIRRLMTETEPVLPDFDGTKIANDRDYRSLDLEDGLAAFARARAETLALLRSVEESSWWRSGTQEGVGPVTLCDMPGFMAQHDTAHRAEIETWHKQFAQ